MQMVKGAGDLNEKLRKGIAFAIRKGAAGVGTAVGGWAADHIN